QLGAREQEIFAVILLDAQLRLIAYEELFTGTIDAIKVHIREVVRAAMRHNAAGVILAHNHPSGNSEPSEADKELTRRIKSVLSMISVRVVDHIIVGETVASFARRGLSL